MRCMKVADQAASWDILNVSREEYASKVQGRHDGQLMQSAAGQRSHPAPREAIKTQLPQKLAVMSERNHLLGHHRSYVESGMLNSKQSLVRCNTRSSHMCLS